MVIVSRMDSGKYCRSVLHFKDSPCKTVVALNSISLLEVSPLLEETFVSFHREIAFLGLISGINSEKKTTVKAGRDYRAIKPG